LCAEFPYFTHMAKLKTRARPENELVEDIAGVVASNLSNLNAMAALKEAERAGLLDGEKDAHVSFRAPKALIEAARRRSGAKGMTEMGTAALAMLAREDPLAEYLLKNRGILGPDHALEF
jgi:hypothetical protein